MKDNLQLMLNLQEDLQNKIAVEKPAYTRDFGMILGKDMSILNLANFLLAQKQSFDDEIQELLQAIGGPDGNASWKYWKTAHEKLYQNGKRFSDLTKEEQYHAQEEMIDILHFVFNMCLALGLTSEQIFDIYFLKNKENINRQEIKY